MPVLGDTRARVLLARLWALESEKNLDFEPGERVPARVAS
jgi:hypothetical protein